MFSFRGRINFSAYGWRPALSVKDTRQHHIIEPATAYKYIDASREIASFFHKLETPLDTCTLKRECQNSDNDTGLCKVSSPSQNAR